MNDSFLYNERVSQEMVKEYFEQIKKSHSQMLMKLETDSQGCEEKREYEFACNEGTYRSPQKRKHNVLGYQMLTNICSLKTLFYVITQKWHELWMTES